MAYDEELNQRFRRAVGGMAGISEKRMMGAVCFFLDGNMLGCASRQKSGEGRFLFRVGKDNQAEALRRPAARIMDQGGRPMRGFVYVDEGACDPETLKQWIGLALSFVATLPAKPK
uniref:TfoX/Sxy family protein n=1 Tax=Pararhizobium sp. IMCC3301 TaxID=3067904 RepID=UPI0027427366|nr:TfoX/Sxy family protein [Pararhizobium sp. IMCC3301]